MRGGSQNISVSIFPITVPIFGGAIAGIEILRPLWQFAAIISGSDPRTALRFDPISCVRRESPGKHRRAVFQGKAKHSRTPLRSEFQFIAQGVGEEVVWRRASL